MVPPSASMASPSASRSAWRCGSGRPDVVAVGGDEARSSPPGRRRSSQRKRSRLDVGEVGRPSSELLEADPCGSSRRVDGDVASWRSPERGACTRRRAPRGVAVRPAPIPEHAEVSAGVQERGCLDDAHARDRPSARPARRRSGRTCARAGSQVSKVASSTVIPWLRAIAAIAGSGSTPSTSQPRSTSNRDALPVPQPTSSTRRGANAISASMSAGGYEGRALSYSAATPPNESARARSSCMRSRRVARP